MNNPLNIINQKDQCHDAVDTIVFITNQPLPVSINYAVKNI